MKKLSFIPVIVLIYLSKMIPFNWIVGSYHLTFSCTSMMAPVIANQFGFSWIFLFLVSAKLWTTPSILLFLVHRLPLFFGAYAYQKRTVFVNLVLPLVCMILFGIHPIGSAALPYTLYWLIPVFLFFRSNTNVSRAVSSVFVMHAVGSVIWLYAADIPATTWMALIPLVAVERLIMMVGILGLDYTVSKVRQSFLLRNFCTKLGIA